MNNRQLGLDAYTPRKGSDCRFLTPNMFTGMKDPDGDVVCMGACSMKAGTVYSRDCENCTLYRRRE